MYRRSLLEFLSTVPVVIYRYYCRVTIFFNIESGTDTFSVLSFYIGMEMAFPFIKNFYQRPFSKLYNNGHGGKVETEVTTIVQL